MCNFFGYFIIVKYKQKHLRYMSRQRRKRKDEQILHLTNCAWIEFCALDFNISRTLTFILSLFKSLMKIVVVIIERFRVLIIYMFVKVFNINVKKYYKKLKDLISWVRRYSLFPPNTFKWQLELSLLKHCYCVSDTCLCITCI